MSLLSVSNLLACPPVLLHQNRRPVVNISTLQSTGPGFETGPKTGHPDTALK